MKQIIQKLRKKGNCRAVTMIEMLLVCVIFTVVMGIVFGTLRLNETFRDFIFIKGQLYRGNRKAYDKIISELERSNNGHIFSPVDASPVSELRFQVRLGNSTTYDLNQWGAFYGNTDYPGLDIRYSVVTSGNLSHLVREVLNSTSGAVSYQEVVASNVVDFRVYKQYNPPPYDNTTITFTTNSSKLTPGNRRVMDLLENSNATVFNNNDTF